MHSGPLMAAAPLLLRALDRFAALTRSDSPVHELAVEAIEKFREREGILFADWRPDRSAPQLRTVGEAKRADSATRRPPFGGGFPFWSEERSFGLF